MILLTGGTGFLGAHIAHELTSKGHKLRALKRKGASISLTEKIFRHYSNDAGTLLSRIEWVEGDLLDIGALEDAMEGVTQVYHSAAVISFFPKDRNYMLQVNIEGTANVVNLALDAGVKKFCHISSIAALGKTTDGSAIHEEVWWKNDPGNSWYAISKYGAEREAWRATEEGMDVIILNPSFIVGPGDTGRSSTEAFGLLKSGTKWYTEGTNGYVDVRDVAAAAVKLMNSERKNERFILNAANLSYREFFDSILTKFGRPKTKYHAGKFLLGLGWRAEKLLCALTGRRPRVTKETAQSALQKNLYDGGKITRTIDFKYRDFETTVEETCEFFC